MILEFPWEVGLIAYLQHLISGNDALVGIFSMISFLGEAYLPGLLICFLYLARDKESGVRFALSVTTSQVFNHMIKNVVCRMRPYMVNDSIECLRPVDPGYDIYDLERQGYSFPSGHANQAAASFSSLLLLSGKRSHVFPAAVIVLLVCLSRVILGVHYPTDVAAGAVLGLTAVLLFNVSYERIGKKNTYLIVIMTAACGFFFCRTDDYYSSFGLLAGIMAGDLFEENYVRFANTSNVFRGVLRTISGAMLMLGVSQILKLPFDPAVLEAPTLFAYAYRSFRYAAGAFVTSGLFPFLFRYDLLRLDDRKKEK